MAYKFQLGAARLSGSLIQEGDVEGQGAADFVSLKVSSGGAIGAGTDLDMMTMTEASDIAIANNIDFNIAKVGGLQLAGVSVASTAAELNYLDGANANINTLVLPASTTISAFGASIVDDADAAAVRTTIGTVIGTNVQAQDAGLQYLADLTITNQATFQEQTGLEIGADVQAWDAQLDTLSGMSANAATAAAALTDAEYAFLDGATVGTVVNSKAVIASAAGDISGVRDLFGRSLSASADLIAGGAINAQTIGIADVSGIIAANSGLAQTSGELHLSSSIAGSGLTLTSGVLDVDLNEATVGVINPANDDFLFIDSDGNATKKDSIVDFMTAVAGSGLVATSGVLEVQVSGAVKLDSDKVGISGSIAGNGLDFAGGADSISSLQIQLNPGKTGLEVAPEGLAIAAAAAGVGLGYSNGVLSANVDDSSLEINTDTLRIKGLGVTNAMLAGSIANAKLVNDSVTVTAGTGLTGGGEVDLGASITVAVDGVLEDLDTLGAPANDGQFIVATGAGVFAYEAGSVARDSLDLGQSDSVQFTDLTLTGDLTVAGALTYVNTTNLAIKDALITIGSGSAAFAADYGFELGAVGAGWASFKTDADVDGAGLDGFNSSLPIKAPSFHGTVIGSIREGVSVFTGSGDLKVGVNKAGTYSTNLNMLLPTGASEGTVVRVKGTANTGDTNKQIQITRQGSDLIDGTNESITLESPFAAVSLIKSSGNEWMVF